MGSTNPWETPVRRRDASHLALILLRHFPRLEPLCGRPTVMMHPRTGRVRFAMQERLARVLMARRHRETIRQSGRRRVVPSRARSRPPRGLSLLRGVLPKTSAAPSVGHTSAHETCFVPSVGRHSERTPTIAHIGEFCAFVEFIRRTLTERFLDLDRRAINRPRWRSRRLDRDVRRAGKSL